MHSQINASVQCANYKRQSLIPKSQKHCIACCHHHHSRLLFTAVHLNPPERCIHVTDAIIQGSEWVVAHVVKGERLLESALHSDARAPSLPLKQLGRRALQALDPHSHLHSQRNLVLEMSLRNRALGLSHTAACTHGSFVSHTRSERSCHEWILIGF